jgi:hypothetical protein
VGTGPESGARIAILISFGAAAAPPLGAAGVQPAKNMANITKILKTLKARILYSPPKDFIWQTLCSRISGWIKTTIVKKRKCFIQTNNGSDHHLLNIVYKK